VPFITFADGPIRQVVVSTHENCAMNAISGALLQMDFAVQFLLDPRVVRLFALRHPEQSQENCAAVLRPELRENKKIERFRDSVKS
jgi:hypothetical protein